MHLSSKTDKGLAGTLFCRGTACHWATALGAQGSAFQQEVWRVLCDIPYGHLTTYGEIARKIAAQRGLASMSAQAVGGAVGHNPIRL